MKILEKIKKTFKNTQKEQELHQIYNRPIGGYRVPLSYRVKQFLKWLDIRDSTGVPIITEETIMGDVFTTWTKSLFIWFVEIFVTGLLIYLAILPFYSVPLRVIPFVVFSFGLAIYVVLNLILQVRNIIKKGTYV